MGTHPIFESDFDCLTDMTELKPYSDKFSELVEEYKNIDSCWKTYSNRLIELAGDLNNFDEQVETIVESCKSGSVLSDRVRKKSKNRGRSRKKCKKKSKSKKI